MSLTYNEQNKYYSELKGTPTRLIEWEIGDSKQSEFYPQFKTKHWDNECNFSVRLSDFNYSRGLRVETEKGIEWQVPEKIVRFYQKLDVSEDGLFEFEVELLEKPVSNVLEFTIQAKEFDFFYQPQLTQEEINNGAVRPENIIGSYAVYHKTKSNNIIDEKEYRAGKAFHIYRPDATDANGKRVWCDLNIDETSGLLNISIPQNFLDTAVYPVIIDPTFGYITAGASLQTVGSSEINTSQFTTIEAGTITTISSYNGRSGAAAGSVGVAIYSDSSDSPNTRLAVDSGDGTVPVLPDWVTMNLSYTFVTSTKYWLANFLQTIGNAYYYDSSAPHRYLGATFETWPDPFVGGSDLSRKVSIYATYTATGIAIDAASNSGEQLAQSTYSWNHTCTGANRYLVVGIGMFSLAQTVSSITYNSIAMTYLGSQSSVSGAARVELWGLIAPSTGSNAIEVTLTGAINSGGVAASYTGVHQSVPTEGFNSAQATNVGAADATVNITTVADNDWVVDIVATDDTSITVGAGQTQRNNIAGTVGAVGNSDEGPKTPAGAVTMSWSNIGALATWAIGGIALRPITASGSSSNIYINIDTFMSICLSL